MLRHRPRDSGCRARAADARYWDALAIRWEEVRPQALWRRHSDAVNGLLLSGWLPDARGAWVLKTDLFDEAVSTGLCAALQGKADRLVGIDLSCSVIRHAVRDRAGLRALAADVRALPFADECFDGVVSLSTLDHFESVDEIATSLREVRRVLRPGAILVLTLDNPLNPLVALRNHLPFGLLRGLGLVPYRTGATCSPRRARVMLEALGFEVTDIAALLHVPRVLAVAVAHLLERYASPVSHNCFLRCLIRFELSARLPWRFVTGHFIALRAKAAK